jgi:hypothetical protein
MPSRLKLQQYSAPYLVLSEVSSDATFTVATYVVSAGRNAVVVMNMIREEYFNQSLTKHVSLTLLSVAILTPLTIWKVLFVCEAVKHLICYLEGRSKFLVVSDCDTLRHLLKQPNDGLNKRQARYVRDVQPLTSAMNLPHCKGFRNEDDRTSQSPAIMEW